ncbi:MAG TPA: ATP-grasp domain-containing protein [Candidatus Scatovivens faecipullorum]|mgnify:CR=1 FL=1|nr:ATP-grasp domain-containing protein [Candidatus Scatovivens faecipullorum]
MRKRVLVLNCGTLASTDINMALRNNEEYEIWGASTSKNHGIYVYKNYIDNIPNISNPEFINILNEKIREYNFKFILAPHEDLALFLQENRNKINACIVCSNYETSLLCRYKSKTYEKMKEYDFIPKVYKKEEVKNYPVFCKKDTDQGGRHAYKIENEDELKMYAKADMIICEYLPGEEVTVDCFTNKKRNLVFCNPRAADRILAGIDVHARRIDLTPEIKYIAESLNKEIEFRGYWFFQIKKAANGKFKLLEIATRLPGSFSLSRCLDVNLPLMALKDFDEQDVELTFNNVEIEADKQFFGKYKLGIDYDSVFIDFETCFEKIKKVDTFFMMYLYQCINKNIKINLLTQDEKKTEEFLTKNKIDKNIFNNILEVKRENIKSLLTKNSIFISNDDNLKNVLRKEVNENCFSNNIIECLIDWRA